MNISYDQVLKDCFRRMGIMEETANIIHLVNGGSGAIIAELSLYDKKLILKYTSSKADVELYRNAQRERSFYKYGASQITLHTPTMVADFEDHAFGIGLLLRNYQQTPHPSKWGNELIIKALTQISRLHAMFLGKEQEVYRIIGEERFQQKFEYQQIEIVKSIEAWEQVYTEKTLDECSPISKEKILQLLRNLDQLEIDPSGSSRTLIHGDFHMENCLLDENQEIVVVDWQSPKLGSGAEDVGNFLARAELYGNPLLTSDYIALYKNLLEKQLCDTLPVDEVNRICHAKRLLLHLFWSPRYVLYYPDHVLTRVLEAIHESTLTLGL